MARPWNEEAERDIAAAAMELLVEEGYRCTTYQAIADRCGLTRTFVQHYIPKKELLITWFLDRALALMDAHVARLRPRAELYEGLVLTGQVYFAFLCNGRIRPLVLDILRDREATGALIDANRLYQSRRTAEEGDLDGAEEVARILGGSYEVLYRRLGAGVAVDPLAESLRVVGAYLVEEGRDAEPVARIAAAKAFSVDELARIVDEVLVAIPERMPVSWGRA